MNYRSIRSLACALSTTVLTTSCATLMNYNRPYDKHEVLTEKQNIRQLGLKTSLVIHNLDMSQENLVLGFYRLPMEQFDLVKRSVSYRSTPAMSYVSAGLGDILIGGGLTWSTLTYSSLPNRERDPRLDLILNPDGGPQDLNVGETITTTAMVTGGILLADLIGALILSIPKSEDLSRKSVTEPKLKKSKSINNAQITLSYKDWSKSFSSSSSGEVRIPLKDLPLEVLEKVGQVSFKYQQENGRIQMYKNALEPLKSYYATQKEFHEVINLGKEGKLGAATRAAGALSSSYLQNHQAELMQKNLEQWYQRQYTYLKEQSHKAKGFGSLKKLVKDISQVSSKSPYANELKQISDRASESLRQYSYYQRGLSLADESKFTEAIAQFRLVTGSPFRNQAQAQIAKLSGKSKQQQKAIKDNIDRKQYDKAYGYAKEKKYQLAINVASRIPAKNPYHARAQKSIQVWNNILAQQRKAEEKRLWNTAQSKESAKITILDGKGFSYNRGYKKYQYILNQRFFHYGTGKRADYDLRQGLGEPDRFSAGFNGATIIFSKAGFELHYSTQGGANQLRRMNFYHPFRGKTSRGLRIGDSEARVKQLYRGKYAREETDVDYVYILNNTKIYVTKTTRKVNEIVVVFN